MIPDIEIQCDEEYQTRRGKWKRCTKNAVVMIVLQHFDDNCERQTIALCRTHAPVVQHNLQIIQAEVEAKAPQPCGYCKKPLHSAEDVGQVTTL